MTENEQIETKEPPKKYNEMTMKEIQELLAVPTSPDIIEWMPQQGSLWQRTGKQWSAIAVPVADVRFFFNRLDQVCGSFNWQTETKFIGGLLLMGLGIRNPEELDEWIWKWDTGQMQEQHTDMIGGGKSVVSQGIKRAGYQWGIARDLYEYPKIVVNCKTRIKQGKEKFSKWTENVWALHSIERRGESTETGRVHSSRVDDSTDVIEAGPDAFSDIALGRLKVSKDQLRGIALPFLDEKTKITDWDKAIKKLEEQLPENERYYTIQEKKKAEAVKE